MKKLNNKGYMLIEIIVAAVLAIGIGYYLIELTFGFSDKNDDLYHSIIITANKTAVTKSIMGDLDNRTVKEIKCFGNDNSDLSCNSSSLSYIKIIFEDDTSSDDTDNPIAKLKIDVNTKNIEYGIIDDAGNYLKNDSSYYTKTFSNEVILEPISVEKTEDKELLYINIPIKTIYDDTDYSIRLLVNDYHSFVDEPNSCVVNVTESNAENVGNTNYLYGWNWNYTTNSNFDSIYCGVWSNYNPLCNATESPSSEENATDECQKTVNYMQNSGFTYIVKFKVNSIGNSVILFGDNNSSDETKFDGFSGFKIDSSGNLIPNFNGGTVNSININSPFETKKWYVIANVFKYSWSSNGTGYTFNSNYTLYVFDGGSECYDSSGTYANNICYWQSNLTWDTSTGSTSTSASNFIVNNFASASSEESNTSQDTDIVVTDALFYFKALEKNDINDFIGSKRIEAIDISDSIVSDPLFYFKNHPSDEKYEES